MTARVRSMRRACAPVVIALLAAAPSTAFAQGAGEQDGGVVLDPITVTATRQTRQILDVPETVTVIGREQLEEQQTRDTQDLVRYVPGVVVDRTTSGTNPFKTFSGFTIRGVSGNRVQMQVDGFRVQEGIIDGTRDFVDFSNMKSIEIVRGPGSVLWGADALGGIVAYRTLDPDDLLAGKTKPWAMRLHTGFDSFDNSFSKSVALAGQIAPTLQGLVIVNQKTWGTPKLSNARADGGIWGCPQEAPTPFRYLPCNKLDPQSTTSWNILGKTVWKPNADHTFKLTGEYYDRDTDVNQLYDFGVVSSGITNGRYDREQILSRQRLSLEHQWNVGSPLIDAVRWQIGYSPQKREVNSDRMQTLANGDLRRTVSTLDFAEEFMQADVQLTSRFAFAGTRHVVTYGFQGDRTTSDYFREDVATNLTTGVTTTTRAGGFNFANATTTRADGYIQDEISLFDDRLTITPGVRFATYKIDPRPNADYIPVPGAEPRVLQTEKWIPQIGAILKLTDMTSLYARYAEGFKMPTAQQLYTSLPGAFFDLVPNPDLKPESVRSYEAGLRFKLPKGYVSVGAFYADYTDFIQSFVEVRPNTYTYQNLSAVTIHGVEISGQYQLSDNLRANFAASYQIGDQVAEPGATEVPFDGATPLNGTLGLRYAMPDYKLELEGVVIAGASVDRASSAAKYMPAGYAVFDSYMTWKPFENVTFRAGVLNIFDTRYFPSSVVSGYNQVPTCTSASNCVSATNPLELQVAPGRTFRVGLTIDF